MEGSLDSTECISRQLPWRDARYFMTSGYAGMTDEIFTEARKFYNGKALKAESLYRVWKHL